MELSDEAKANIMLSLKAVGPLKMVGYLPFYTIREVLDLKLQDIESEARRRGLIAVRFEPDQCCIESSALYVYDRQSLSELLMTWSPLLQANKWPFDPDIFVQTIANEWLAPEHPIMPIIRKAFADEPHRMPDN